MSQNDKNLLCNVLHLEAATPLEVRRIRYCTVISIYEQIFEWRVACRSAHGRPGRFADDSSIWASWHKTDLHLFYLRKGEGAPAGTLVAVSYEMALEGLRYLSLSHDGSMLHLMRQMLPGSIHVCTYISFPPLSISRASPSAYLQQVTRRPHIYAFTLLMGDMRQCFFTCCSYNHAIGIWEKKFAGNKVPLPRRENAK